MSFKKVKVVMLPTNEKAVIGFLTQKGKERGHLVHFDRPMPNILDSENQHLYFLSDEEIKEGDYNVPSDFSKISDISRTSKEDLPIVNDKVNGYKKIIATTDKSLFINEFIGYTYTGGKSAAFSHKNLPQPSDSFIQKYVSEYNKGNVITEVMVEYNLMNKGYDKPEDYPYQECEILKVNPKDNTITIRKFKDSWNRDEVEEKIRKGAYVLLNGSIGDFDKWIEENL